MDTTIIIIIIIIITSSFIGGLGLFFILYKNNFFGFKSNTSDSQNYFLIKHNNKCLGRHPEIPNYALIGREEFCDINNPNYHFIELPDGQIKHRTSGACLCQDPDRNILQLYLESNCNNNYAKWAFMPDKSLKNLGSNEYVWMIDSNDESGDGGISMFESTTNSRVRTNIFATFDKVYV